MAILDDEQKKQQDQGNQQIDPTQTQSASNAGSVAGSGASAGTSGQVGTGGQGQGWTNIQNYLDANKNDTYTSDALNKYVGGEFDKEQNSYKQSSQDTLKQANDTAQNNYLGKDYASQAIEKAGNGPSDEWQKINSSLNAQYSGPSQWNYGGIGAKAQEYGTNLSKDPNALMEDIYKQSSNGQLGGGSLMLQKQLDRDNSAVIGTRNNLLQKYTGLNEDLSKTASDTQASLDSTRDKYANNQSDLRNYLTSQSQDNKRILNNLVAEQQMQGDTEFNRNLARLNSVYKNDPLLNQYVTRGDKVTESNVADGDLYRNKYNFIEKALGLGDTIKKGESAKQGKIDIAGYQKKRSELTPSQGYSDQGYKDMFKNT